MHRFSRMHLPAAEAMRKLDTIDLEEKSRIAEGVALIAVIDHRRDYLAAGYSCMRDYCMGRLHMSEDQAFRRIQVARAALDFPDVFEHLADGRLTVTTASVLAPHLQLETVGELLAAAAYRSRPEIVRLLAERSRPTEAPALLLECEASVETPSSSLAPVQVNSLADVRGHCSSEPADGSPAPAQVKCPRRGRVSPSLTGGYDVRLSITDDEHEDLRRAQALLGHAVPSGDPALVYARAMKHYLAHLEKQRLGAKPGAAAAARIASGRGIPKPLRRLVWERDGGRCTFVSEDGHRCEATSRLELDHIQPIALGGRTASENLRVLCRAHNQYEAERVLGKEFVQRRRELAERERARGRVASATDEARARARAKSVESAAREQEPGTPRHPQHDDILAALRGLGFDKAEARRGAELADAKPEASLEVCLRLALTELTRQVVIRGERRAKCSA